MDPVPTIFIQKKEISYEKLVKRQKIITKTLKILGNLQY